MTGLFGVMAAFDAGFDTPNASNAPPLTKQNTMSPERNAAPSRHLGPHSASAIVGFLLLHRVTAVNPPQDGAEDSGGALNAASEACGTEMPRCCVPLCSNHSRKGMRMFRVSTTPSRRKLLLAQVKRDFWEPTAASAVCFVSTVYILTVFSCGTTFTCLTALAHPDNRRCHCCDDAC